MTDIRKVNLEFVSGALPDADIELRSVVGRERISRLFEFDLVLAKGDGPFTDGELDQLLKARCAIAFGPGEGDVVHGILAHVELLDGTRTAAARYGARLVPPQWLLTLARSNRIFPDMTVPQMVEQILTDYGFARGQDFDIMVSGGTKREYVVQYEESDWDFIQRWLDYEGYFYWFEHHEQGDKLIIADNNDDTTPIKGDTTISYRERNNLSAGDTATVWSWNMRQKRIAARVAVLDYNYRTPHIPLVAKHDADVEHGFGSVFSYGENFKDLGGAAAIAQLRAERVACERKLHFGETDCSRFRVGHRFELENHHIPSQDGEYLLTAVEHRAGFDGGNNLGYMAKFECVPKGVPFRPDRATPWPRIHGVLHAHIDADTAGDYAQIDELGRYKVKMPFDVSGRKGTKSSHWIRLAEPYAGARYGSHHPLHKGTEVLVAHIDGNPDRPVIVASVPNAHTVSPVTKANATQSVTQTASGMRLEWEDLQS